MGKNGGVLVKNEGNFAESRKKPQAQYVVGARKFEPQQGVLLVLRARCGRNTKIEQIGTLWATAEGVRSRRFPAIF
jgi:hypothetical protein